MSTYRSIFALLASYGILLLSNGLFGTIVAIRTKSEAFPEALIGIVMSGYFVGMLLSSLQAVKIVASIGHIRAFASFASIASTVALAHLLWINPGFWFILRLISGFCMGGMIVVTEGWLNERATNKNRGNILSLYMITTYACAGLAQLLLMLGSTNANRLFIIVSMLYSFALLPILMTQSQAPMPSQPRRANIKQLFNTSSVGMVGTFMVGILNGIFYGLMPIYAYSLGLSLEQTAIFIALSLASGMLLQLPLGKLSDKVDRRYVMAFSALMTSVACYRLFTANNDNMTWLYVAAVFYGSVAFSINPICIAHVNDLAPADERTQTASGLLMLYGIGAVIGPLLGGLIMPFGVNYIFLLSGIVALIFGVYALIRTIVKPRHGQQKRKFRPFSLQSPARKLGFSHKSSSDSSRQS